MRKHRIFIGIAALVIVASMACAAAGIAAPAEAAAPNAAQIEPAGPAEPAASGESAASGEPAAPTEPAAPVVSMERQTLGMETLGNARQLGGYVGADGRTVREGVLLRTARLAGASESDLARLVDVYGLGYVIDLRSSSEIESAPDPAIEGVESVWCPILEEKSEKGSAASDATKKSDTAADAAAQEKTASEAASKKHAGHTMDLEAMYLRIADSEYSQRNYRAFFDVLLGNEDGKAVLWHCVEGKDRTGFAAVLVLSALGVDRETVLDDFALTNDFLLASGKELVGSVGVYREHMECALSHIDEAYGSMHDYLVNQIGLSEDEIARLREMYLEG